MTAMGVIVTVVGVLIVAGSIVMAVAPERFVHLIVSMDSRIRFRYAVVVRLILGVLFILAAPGCREPGVVRVIGVLTLVAAAALLVVGRQRLDTFMEWWLGRPRPRLRAWSILGVALGVLLIYSGA